MTNKRRKRAAPSGFSLLELQVAFVLFGIALAGLGPLVVMQLRQIKMLETRFNDQTTYYLAPSTNAWARKLGAAASIQTEDPGPPAATGSAFEAHVNFQRPADPDPGVFDGNDYEADGGRAFGDRGNGYSYGWDRDNTSTTGNRNHDRSFDERYDTLAHMQKPEGASTWEIAVPNGTYQVHLVAGDPSYFDSTSKINVEGLLTIDGVRDENNRWLEATATVTVTDGRLTVSNAPGATENKLCFIDVLPGKKVRILSLTKSLISEEVTARVEVVDR